MTIIGSRASVFFRAFGIKMEYKMLVEPRDRDEITLHTCENTPSTDYELIEYLRRKKKKFDYS